MSTHTPNLTPPWQRFSHEQQVLLWALRFDDRQDADVHAVLSGRVDWDTTLELARDHGMLPRLYVRLKTLADDLIPADVLSRLQSLYVTNAVGNFRKLQRLLGLLALLESHGVRAIPVKGLALALQAYNDVAMRHFVDLDIVLASPSDYFTVYRLLIGQGFTPETTLTEAEVRPLQQRVSNQHFIDGQITLEVHWTIPEREYGFTLNGATLWSHCSQQTLGNQPFHTLSREDALLLHILHAHKHQWNKMIWIADCVTLARHPEIDWRYLVGEMRRMGAMRILHIGLSLMATLGGYKIPDYLQTEMASDRRARQLVEYLYTTFFIDMATSIAHFPHFIYHSRERLRDKLHYLTYPRFNDQTVIQLPKPLFPLYYLIRPLRLLGKLRSRGVTAEFHP